jgi:uncharacterized protein YacL
MQAVLQALMDSPVSAVLIAAQIFFIGLTAVAQIHEGLRSSQRRQLQLGLMGLVFFAIGIAIALLLDRP